MAINFNSDFPLIVAGTQVVLNPSFEDWDVSNKPVGWLCTGAPSAEAAYAYPCGVYAAKWASAGATNCLKQAVTLASFGLSAFPSWATSWVLGCVVQNTGSPVGSMRINYASTYVSAALPTGAGPSFCFLELPHATGDPVSIELRPLTSGSGATYLDSVFFGLALDIPVPFSDWHPIPKFKQETRESPLNITTQLLSDAQDAKMTFCKFGPTLKAQLLGWRRWAASGHYNAVIFDRGSSAPYSDEWMPYLIEQGQEGPKFYPGAGGTFDTSWNMRGCLP